MGTESSHSHRVVPDLGSGDCGAGILCRSRHLCAVLRQARQFASENPAPSLRDSEHACLRHSQVARLFHWIMAASMLTLLFTAFLPKVGVQFPWVTYHWIAGTVLTVSILFHIFHASFWLDFWSIWPDRMDMTDAYHRVIRSIGRPAPPPRKFAKYPFENKLYHGAIIVAGLSAIATGVFMMFRVRTIFFTRNPYLFSDMTWGMVYVLHGLAGVGLIALIMVHIYFGIRPEKLPDHKVDDLRLDESRVLSGGARSRAVGSYSAECGAAAHWIEGRGLSDAARNLGAHATRSKNATNSCSRTPREGVRAMRMESRADRFANFYNAPRLLSQTWPKNVRRR